METEHTTAAVGRFLQELAGDAPAEPVVRALLERAAGRLHLLCATLLYRSYPRLARPPVSLQSEEMLSAVVERLLKAMREVRPGTVRQFFALANQHMRWELNDLARRLDEQAQAVTRVSRLSTPASSTSMRFSADAACRCREFSADAQHAGSAGCFDSASSPGDPGRKSERFRFASDQRSHR